MAERIGLIAGNGTFPLLVLDAARAQGFDVIVAAIKEEAFPEIEAHGATAVHWLSLGEFPGSSKLSSAKACAAPSWPDRSSTSRFSPASVPTGGWPSCCFLLGTRNTDSLLGAVAKTLADEGITLENSTAFLEPLLAKAGVLTSREPRARERKNIDYGRAVARQLAQYDIGQTVVVAESACVAVEAMEGTDATIERAGEIMRSLAGDASTLSRELTVVKIAKPNQDMRFDVPVVGVKTIDVMRQAGATCLALDAGKCLLLDGQAIITAADSAKITIMAD